MQTAAHVDPLTAARLFESSTDWMWVIDTDGRHRFTNGAIEQILGYTPEEMMRVDDFIELVHPDDLPRMGALMEHAVATRSGWSAEVFRWRHRDGTYRWLESNGMPLFERGELTGFCGADRDITPRMEQERRFRMTFERAGVGMAHLGVDGRWLRVNEPLCEILGYDADELLALRFHDVTHPDDLGADLAQFARLVAGETPSFSIEKRYIRKDGTVIWGMLTRSVVRDDAGNIEYTIAVVRDITTVSGSRPRTCSPSATTARSSSRRTTSC
jgi:PAS domain S-box-containing protein